MSKEIIFTRNASGLVRELSWIDVFAMMIATPAASGILYYSVSNASSYPGGSVSLAFLLGLVMFLPICITIAFVSSTMPRSGSMYVAISRLIHPSIAYMGSFLFIFGYALTIGVLGWVIMGILGGLFSSLPSSVYGVGIVNFGDSLSTPLGRTLGGILWIVFFWLTTILGLRTYKLALRVFFIIPLAATIFIIIYFFSINSGNLMQAFDASWGAGTFQAIVSAARSHGWTPAYFSWNSTLGLLLVVIWAYGGIEMASYAGGEIKNPRRNILTGFAWGALSVGLLYILLSTAIEHSFGSFLSAYDFMFRHHVDILMKAIPPVEPSVPFYVFSVIGNPTLAIAIVVAIVLWFANTIPPFFLGISRLIFSLAMDRAIPEKLANINQKTCAPTWATHMTAIIALGGVLLSLLGAKTVLATIDFLIFFMIWLYGLAAMLLPYRRPDIFEKSPVQYRLWGLPVITLLGFVTFGIGWFIMFYTISHMVTSVYITVSILLSLSMVAYFYQQNHNAQKRIDYNSIYSQMPPE
jgi:APA family basic amino acid/polyamine antiporter